MRVEKGVGHIFLVVHWFMFHSAVTTEVGFIRCKSHHIVYVTKWQELIFIHLSSSSTFLALFRHIHLFDYTTACSSPLVHLMMRLVVLRNVQSFHVMSCDVMSCQDSKLPEESIHDFARDLAEGLQ